MDRPELESPEVVNAAAPRERNRAVAGTVTVIVHIAALLLLVLFWTGASRRAVDEPSRGVGVRLVSKASLQRESVVEETTGETGVEIASTSTSGPANLASVLPSAVPPDSLPDFVPLEHQQGTPARVDLPGFEDAGPVVSVFPGTAEGDAEIIAQEQERLLALQQRGKISQVRLFGGAMSNGRSFVFAIDRSQSMGAEGIGAIDAAVDELARAVDGLDQTNQFQIVAYNRNLIFLDGERKMLAKSGESREKTRKFIDTLSAFGPTEHHRALLSALALSPEVIYLLTDGGDPGLTDLQIAQVQRIAGSRTTVHVVCFGRKEISDSAESLRRLTEACRGSFTFVDLSKRD